MKTTTRTILVLLLLGAASAGADDGLLLDGFDNLANWRIGTNISGDGTCELTATTEAKVGPGAMVVTDRGDTPHAQWLEKRCSDGTWDLSRWQKVHLWVRGDGSRRPVYFKVLDEAGRLMFWKIGRLDATEWRCFTLDLARAESLDRHENPNLARIAVVGIRLAPHCGYEIALDDLWVSDPIAAPVAQGPEVIQGERLGYLAPRHVDEIEDSIVGVNLHPGVGDLTEKDLDRLAAAGVKWAARLPLDLESEYGESVRKALLKHRFRLHGLFGVHGLLTDEELAERLQQVRATVAGLKDIVSHWEIGNEPNIGKFWSDHPNATEFGQMVCAFAEAIRAEQPEAVIISGGMVGYPLDFGKEMMDTGMGKRVDYVGIHTPRSRPEDGGGGLEHGEALERFRKLIRSYNADLDVWQSEVQATPNVTFAEVRGGITDFQQARHVARRFFIEQWLGYPASFWQLFKAGPLLDHPGALLRVDGTPTMKFFAIQNVAAILDKRLDRNDVPAEVECLEAPVLLAEESGRRIVRASESYASSQFPVPFGVNVDVRLEAVTEGTSIDVRLVWLDERGEEVESVSRTTPVPARAGANVVCRRYPHAFRPAGATHGRVEIRAPKKGEMRIEKMQVGAYSQFVDARAYVFRRRDDGAWFVPYSLVPRPPIERVKSTCRLRVNLPADSFSAPVVVDMIDGSVRRVKAAREEDGRLVFDGLPMTDYSLVLTDARWLRVQPKSCLVSQFADTGDLMRQFVSDRFGRGRPEFWRLVDAAMEDEQGILAAALDKAERIFCTRLKTVEGDVQVQGLPLVAREVRDPCWRSSIVNEKSQHADRYFARIRCGTLDESEIRVLVGGKPLPKRGWKDSEANIGTWMATQHPGEVRVFVGVANGAAMTEDVTIEYRVCPCTARICCFLDRQNQEPCVVFWCEPFENLPLPEGTASLVASGASLPRGATVVNLVTGERVEGVETSVSGGKVEIRGIPIAPSPVLIGGRR